MSWQECTGRDLQGAVRSGDLAGLRARPTRSALSAPGADVCIPQCTHGLREHPPGGNQRYRFPGCGMAAAQVKATRLALIDVALAQAWLERSTPISSRRQRYGCAA